MNFKRREQIPVGYRFGRLVTVEPALFIVSRRVRCKCDCGGESRPVIFDIANGRVTGCGCGTRPHGMHGTPEYMAWVSLKQRCCNPKHKAYRLYGGRGVRVCRSWRESFAAFYADVGPRPSSGHSLDRYPDNDGDYKPGNVRWATTTEQSRNRRTARMIPAHGETLSLCEWSERNGISVQLISYRLKSGWAPEAAVSTQPKAS